MNVKNNSKFKSVELFDKEIDISMLIENCHFTIHALSQRSERFNKVFELNKTDDGTQAPFDRIFRVDRKHEEGIELHCVTKNGIIFILNEEKYKNQGDCIVTVLLARVNQAKRLYDAAKIKFPESIRSKCNEWEMRGLNEC